MMRIIELFAGIGSQTQALKNISVEHEVAAISEIDKYAMRVYEALHGTVNNLGDITKIEELPDADLWTYSFPCQSCSVAGAGLGLDKGSGTASSLLWEVERLLLRARDNGTLPKYLLMENVKNLIGHRHKANFEKWSAFLNSLGYKNYYKILNAKHYGIPQNRERVFCVSILGEHEPYAFPESVPLTLRLKDMLEDEVDEKYYLDGDVSSYFAAKDYKDPKCVAVGKINGGKWDNFPDICRRVYGAEGLCPTITACGGGQREPKVMCLNSKISGRQPSICDRVYDSEGISTAVTTSFHPSITEVRAGQFRPIDRDYNKNGTRRVEQFECRKDEVSNALLTGSIKNCICIVTPNGQCNEDGKADCARTVRCGGRGSLDNHSWDVVLDGSMRVRKLTPRECLRLMAWTDVQIDKIQAAGISNSQQYKIAGNGIVLQVLEAVFRQLFL